MLEDLANQNQSSPSSAANQTNENSTNTNNSTSAVVEDATTCDAKRGDDNEGSKRRHQGQSTSTDGSCANTANGDDCKQPYDLGYFVPDRILNNNSAQKSVSLVGHFTNLSAKGDGNDYAIVVLEKKAFTEQQLLVSSVTKANSDGDNEGDQRSATLPKTKANSESETASVEASRCFSFFSSASRLKTEFINDIYGSFQCVTDPEINQLKVTIIYPANEKLIVKYSAQEIYLIEETAHDYQTVTLPHLNQEQLSLEWLYNVLEHRKEKERIVFEDPSDDTGFILLPDLKWDGRTLEQLYLLALVRPRGIKSLRDLTAAHLPLLKNLRDKGTAAIKERYGLAPDQLRVYLHYQPSFYHLHVHFTYLKHDPPGIKCEKSHLLSTVISNLELLPEYYQKSTLACVLKETDTLYAKFKAARSGTEEPEAKRVKLAE
ncbi:m7GpppX diphosphatase [Uranotaenia lowii]|uniref:m7GpppX diphosphatase n=1 Tax=Uranotaenia lowii TaxID=190385 RepID=UPI00247A9C8B|nr:m7GpppX diphosphatase [Uranotaenia lowii]